jgi:hypothetical protein
MAAVAMAHGISANLLLREVHETAQPHVDAGTVSEKPVAFIALAMAVQSASPEPSGFPLRGRPMAALNSGSAQAVQPDTPISCHRAQWSFDTSALFVTAQASSQTPSQVSETTKPTLGGLC